MKTTAQKLNIATRRTRQDNQDNNNKQQDHEINSFIELYYVLGETELKDGIASAMQDAGYEETYEDIMYHYNELS